MGSDSSGDNHMKRKNQKIAYVFITPALVVMTVFVFVPLVAAFIFSFMNMDIYMKDISFAGFGNYIVYAD